MLYAESSRIAYDADNQSNHEPLIFQQIEVNIFCMPSHTLGMYVLLNVRFADWTCSDRDSEFNWS